MGYDAKASRAIEETGVGLGAVGGAAGGQRGQADVRECVVELILRHFVSRDIEAGGVGDVVDVEGVFQRVLFLQVDDLNQGNIGTLLECLAEDIALTGREAGLKWVVAGDCAVQTSGGKQRKGEAFGLQSGNSCNGKPRAGGLGESVLCRTALRQGNDRVGDAVGGGIVDAAHCAG